MDPFFENSFELVSSQGADSIVYRVEADFPYYYKIVKPNSWMMSGVNRYDTDQIAQRGDRLQWLFDYIGNSQPTFVTPRVSLGTDLEQMPALILNQFEIQGITLESYKWQVGLQMFGVELKRFGYFRLVNDYKSVFTRINRQPGIKNIIGERLFNELFSSWARPDITYENVILTSEGGLFVIDI